MANEWPKMMYLHDGSLEYKVANSRQEAAELASFGFVFEPWGVEPKEPCPMPEQEAPKKEQKPKKDFSLNRCKVCNRHLKKFSHIHCKEKINASTIKKTEEINGNSGASSIEALQGKQGSNENEQVSTA
jgi:hypothetical protein